MKKALSYRELSNYFKKSPAKAVRIALCGDYAIDRFVLGRVERISPEAPVPVLNIEKEFEKLGCAANVAANMSELQIWPHELSLWGRSGKDKTSLHLKKKMQDMDPTIKMNFWEDSEWVTPVKTRYMADRQHQLLRVDQEKIKELSREDEESYFSSIQKEIPSLDLIILQDYAKGLLSENLLQKIIQEAQKHSVKTVLDPHIKTSPEFYVGASLATPNLIEAEAILDRRLDSGRSDKLMEEAARDLKKRLKLSNVLITRGAYGMTGLCEDGSIFHLPTLARTVFDVTGAGDTVVAVLSLLWARGASLKEASMVATAAASHVVSQVGTAVATPDDIVRELKSFDRDET